MKISRTLLAGRNLAEKAGSKYNALTGVYFKGNKSVATNRKMLSLITDTSIPNSSQQDTRIENESIKDFLHLYKKNNVHDLDDINRIQNVKTINEKYVSYECIIPRKKAEFEISFDAKQMLEMCKSIIEFQDAKKDPARFKMRLFKQDQAAMLISIKKKANFIGLIMPMRSI